MSVGLPSNLPAISNARLPQTYERAKQAIAECSRIDECKTWADQAEALASYARQAKDDELRRMADRIQARAIRRCGELLKTFQTGPQGGRPKNTMDGQGVSQRKAACDAGLSEFQELTAVRVANIPEEEFEQSVASEDPPTVTALAERGKKSQAIPIIDIGERDPAEFALSTQGQGHLRRFAEFCIETDAGIIARGAMPHEVPGIKANITIIDGWLDQLAVSLET